jgi:NitT/TauT family transport system substrate-binding protein
MKLTRTRIAVALAATAVTFGLLLAACGSSSGSSNATPASGTTNTAPKDVTLRLGYFANLTHAQAVIGVADGTYKAELGDHVKLETKVFNAGPAEIEALFAGELDAAYVGPNPAVNGYTKSDGKALRIVAGGASAGALFVVRSDANITKPADLANKKISDPQLGGTQDVALRAYIAANGLKPKENGGNVTILPTANADTLTLFKKGDIDGAWVPEPWATRLVQEAGGKVFLDERSLWPNGDFATTVLVVSTDFLKKNPDAVRRLISAHVKVTQAIAADPDKAKAAVNQGIKDLTGAGIAAAVMDAAWKNLRFTNDPVAASISKQTDDAFKLQFLGASKPDLKDLYDLAILNDVLKANNLPLAVAK